jgi:hypothetical protein
MRWYAAAGCLFGSIAFIFGFYGYKGQYIYYITLPLMGLGMAPWGNKLTRTWRAALVTITAASALGTGSRSPFVRAVAEGCIAALAGVAVHAYGNFDWRIRHLWLLLALSSGLRIAAERTRWAAMPVKIVVPEPWRPNRTSGDRLGTGPLESDPQIYRAYIRPVKHPPGILVGAAAFGDKF